MNWPCNFNAGVIVTTLGLTGAMTGYVAALSEESVGSSLIALISGLIAAGGYSLLVAQKRAAEVDDALRKIGPVAPGIKAKLRRLLIDSNDTGIVPGLWLIGLVIFAAAFFGTQKYFASNPVAKYSEYKEPKSFFNNKSNFDKIDATPRFRFLVLRLRCIQLGLPIEEYDAMMTMLRDTVEVDGKTTPPCEEALKYLASQKFERSGNTLSADQ